MNTQEIDVLISELVEQYPPDNSYDFPMIQIPAKDLKTILLESKLAKSEE